MLVNQSNNNAYKIKAKMKCNYLLNILVTEIRVLFKIFENFFKQFSNKMLPLGMSRLFSRILDMACRGFCEHEYGMRRLEECFVFR